MLPHAMYRPGCCVQQLRCPPSILAHRPPSCNALPRPRRGGAALHPHARFFFVQLTDFHLVRLAPAAGRGQADPLTADDVAAILATASIPRRTGRGMESEAAAADRGATDKALAGLLFQGGLRRSEAAALRWADVQDAADGRGIVVYVRRSKTDQDGTAADVRYLKRGCAAALRQLRDRITVQRSGLRPDGTAPVLGGINGQSIARRLTAAASAAGIEGRITGHSGAGRPCRRIDQARRTRAGDGQGGRVEVVTDGCPLRGRRRSRAGRRRYLPVAGARAARRTSGAPHPHRRVSE